MRAVLGLLCLLSLTCNAASDADPTSIRSAKLAAAEALLAEIAAWSSNGKAEDLPEGLARAVESWTDGSADA